MVGIQEAEEDGVGVGLGDGVTYTCLVTQLVSAGIPPHKGNTRYVGQVCQVSTVVVDEIKVQPLHAPTKPFTGVQLGVADALGDGLTDPLGDGGDGDGNEDIQLVTIEHGGT